MTDHFEIRINPEASTEDREAVMAALRQSLHREAGLARPSQWRLSGWVAQRVGITDVSRWMPPSRVWPSSTHLPWGGRPSVGLVGRGDAK